MKTQRFPRMTTRCEFRLTRQPGSLPSIPERGFGFVALVTLCSVVTLVGGERRGFLIQSAQAAEQSTAECTVAPRPWSDFVAFSERITDFASVPTLGTPSAMLEPPSDGSSASPEVASAVTSTAEELIACSNAGDLGRLYALYSDSYIEQNWGHFLTQEITAAELEEARVQFMTVEPATADERIELVSVDHVMDLPDGRVSAVVKNTRGGSLAVFVQSGSHYLLDAAFPLPDSGTLTP